MESISKYEVRCPRCQVSFPVGTRQCIHCGGPTGPSRIGGERRQGAPGQTEPLEDAAQREVLHELEQEIELEGRPGRMRTVITALWVLLAIVFSILRACSERG